MTTSLKLERIIPGRPEEVFDAWLDSETLKRWMTPGPGMSVPEASVDAVVGGGFRIVMQAGETRLPHEGVYRVIDRPRRLVFTWISAHAGNTLVTIEFEAVGPMKTRLRLVHEQFKTEAARDNHQGGWAKILDALERAMEVRS
jgi:uncharacterized protein YndB with AHSA1/START domain